MALRNRSITLIACIQSGHPEFAAWIDGLKDKAVRDVVVSRIKRAGWRLYFTICGSRIVILLIGGPKRTQEKDIKRAKALASMLYQAEELK